MTDMRVMLDLDSETLREMLAQRLYENESVGPGSEHVVPWEDAPAGRVMSYQEADYALNALRGLAADGLLVRG